MNNLTLGRHCAAFLAVLLTPALLHAAPVPRATATAIEGYYGDPRDPIALRYIEGRATAGQLFVELPDRADEVIATADGHYILASSNAPFAVDSAGRHVTYRGHKYPRTDWREPALPTREIAGMIGDYQCAAHPLRIFERNGNAYLLDRPTSYVKLIRTAVDRWVVPPASTVLPRSRIVLDRDAVGTVQTISFAGQSCRRKAPVRLDDDGLTPAQRASRIAALRSLALAATPPVETGKLLPDLVSINTIAPAIRLDIRYATANNFLGTPTYARPVAMLQRPAAEALKRVAEGLRMRGYGLVVFDGYRPWYVTKIFWDATKPSDRDFVANPEEGSKHNRGAAVDLSMFKLATGEQVDMPGGYDETSERSYPTYVGGSSHQRWLRDLLRAAMIGGEFEVDGFEWWHFNYARWERYPIGNEELSDR
jgi:D-alanyl-D-alanine dipeptidase